MNFKKLTDEEITKLDALRSFQQTLARAELMEALARLRLEFSDQAEEEIGGDPWFRDQDEFVRIAIMVSITERRARELSRLAEAQLWLSEAPLRIASLRDAFSVDESLEGRLDG